MLSQPLHIFRDAEHSPVAAADAAAGSPASATVPLDLVHERESTSYKTMSAESAMQQAYGWQQKDPVIDRITETEEQKQREREADRERQR